MDFSHRSGRRADLAGWMLAVTAGLPLLAGAQQYPVRPVKVVVGYSAGGAVDIVAQTLGQSLSGSMGQPVIVVEKLRAEVQKALQTREVRERISAVGGEVIPGSSAMLASLLRSERQRYEKLVREVNIKPD